ncbi:MAG: TlpA family protein disulfide reductase [Desulfovibrionaceae bacterium]
MKNNIVSHKNVFRVICLVFLIVIHGIVIANAGEGIQSFSAKRDVLNLIRNNSGKVVILSVSASWCAVCKSEVKELNRLQAFYKGKVVVYGLALDEEKEKVAQFKQETEALYPIFQITEKIGLDFRVSAIPHLFFYDPNGILYMDTVGLQDTDALKEIIDVGIAVDEHAGHNHD